MMTTKWEWNKNDEWERRNDDDKIMTTKWEWNENNEMTTTKWQWNDNDERTMIDIWWKISRMNRQWNTNDDEIMTRWWRWWKNDKMRTMIKTKNEKITTTKWQRWWHDNLHECFTNIQNWLNRVYTKFDTGGGVLQYMNIWWLSMKEQDEENERKFHSYEDSWNRIRNVTY